jgi:DNA-directed RNA polymerase specialized sigma24 family protein
MDVAALRPAMWRYAITVTRGDAPAAEDAIQEAWLLWLRRADPTPPALGVLCRLIRRAAVDEWRHRTRWGRVSMVPLDAQQPAAGDPERDYCHRETLAEIAAFPQADLLFLDAAGWSDAELAARYGTTVAALRMRLSRLRHGPIARISPW